MSLRAELARKRYAEDPDYRARKLAANHAWDKTHRPQLNAWKRNWRAQRKIKDPQGHAREVVQKKAGRLRGDYGITLADYERMLKQQRGRCAICKDRPAERLNVDHCHRKHTVRRLLCRRCNTGLGGFRDDIHLLREAINYLREFEGAGPARVRPAVHLRRLWKALAETALVLVR